MPGDTENPRIWVNADAYVAPVGTTAPDDIETAWDALWEPLGLLSEDGMVESRDEDSTDHYAWGGVLVRTTRSKHKRTIQIAALEDNPFVFGLVNPGSTSVDTAPVVGPPAVDGYTTRTVKVPTADPRAFGLELVDGGVVKRRVIPRGEVAAVGDVTASDSGMAMYELTINIYPSSTGVLYLDITNDPQAVTA